MLKIAAPIATEQAAQDAPGATIGTVGDLQVHPISSSLRLTGAFNVSASLTASERLKRVWTLPSLWTHRTRPQGTWKTADSFPQRPHPSFFPWKKKEERRANDKNSATQLSTKSDQGHVFALSSNSAFAVLSARVHEVFAAPFSSTLEDRLGYRPSDCFETFPFPEQWASNADMERTGREYYDFRAALMVRNDEGLTETYNRFHDPDECDPDILKLRDLHAAMDRAVLDAYGWTDIQPRCEFILDYVDDEEDEPGKASKKKRPWRYRWPDEIRDEVLGRLLELNAQRAKEEALAGIKEVAPGGAKSKKRSLTRKSGFTPLLD